MVNKNVFSRLKRLFSNQTIIRNIGGTQIKTIDTDRLQSLGLLQTNSIVDRFNRMYTTTGAYAGLYNNINYQYLRIQLYNDYSVMDDDAIIASTLDILADECTLKNEAGEVLQIRSTDENIQKILYNLFYDVLNIEFNLWSWIREMCKYGDFFLKLDITEEFGVYNVVPYSAYNIIREEGVNPENPQYVRFRYDPNALMGGNTQVITNSQIPSGETVYFDNYEIAHFRLIAGSNFLPYGRSYIEPARKVWKAYALMEDAMLIHRIMRAPERRIHYINIGNIPPNDVEAYMQKIIQTQKKTPYIDPSTGQYNLKFNMQNMMEDYYIPLRGNDTNTKIETLAGLQYNGIEDVNYLRDKLFAALKVPKAYMGYEADLEGKATLAAEDIRFARTVERIQRIIISELTKIALVHLYTQGYEGESMTNFELSLTNPSIIYDQERVALLKEKVDLASSIMENNLMPTDWIYENIFHFSEDQYDELRDLVVEDKKRQFRYGQLENEGNDPAESGQSYGTPHDLASLYGKNKEHTIGKVPPGFDETEGEMGRPQERVSNINTQDNPFGKDRLGNKGLSKTDNSGENGNIRPQFKGNSPLTLESKSQYARNKHIFNKLPTKNKKSLIFEKVEKSVLDEDNILSEDTLN